MATMEQRKKHKEYLVTQFRPYNGNSDILKSVIATIESISEDTNASLIETTVNWIKGRLIGKASVAIDPTIVTFQGIIDALKTHIVPETSGEILAKMEILTINNNNYEHFMTQADEMSEALRKAYINESIPREIALKMTIEKTIEICRKASDTDLVKASLQHGQLFDTPKEVISTFIIETMKEKQEFSITKENFRILFNEMENLSIEIGRLRHIVKKNRQENYFRKIEKNANKHENGYKRNKKDEIIEKAQKYEKNTKWQNNKNNKSAQSNEGADGFTSSSEKIESNHESNEKPNVNEIQFKNVKSIQEKMEIMKEAHIDKMDGSHYGSKKTYAILKSNKYFWRQMTRDIQSFVKNCSCRK